MNQQIMIITAVIFAVIIMAHHNGNNGNTREHFYNELQATHFYNDRTDHEGYDYVKPSYFGHGYRQCCDDCVSRYNVQTHDLKRARNNASTCRSKLFATEDKLRDAVQLRDYYKGLAIGYKRRLLLSQGTEVTAGLAPPYWFTVKQPNTVSGLGLSTMTKNRLVI